MRGPVDWSKLWLSYPLVARAHAMRYTVSDFARKSHRLNRRGGSWGFSLIELLVVIAIVAALLSILLPSLSKARENANEVLGLNNQRQIQTSITMYTNEYRGAYPQPKRDSDIPLMADRESALWFVAVDKFMPGSGVTTSPAGSATLISSMVAEVSAKQDPVWEEFSPADRLKNRTIKMNDEFGESKRASGSDDGIRFVRDSNIKHSANTVMIGDGRAADIASAATFNAHFHFSEGSVGLRHRQGANIGFADGHAGYIYQDTRMMLSGNLAWYPESDPRQKLAWDIK